MQRKWSSSENPSVGSDEVPVLVGRREHHAVVCHREKRVDVAEDVVDRTAVGNTAQQHRQHRAQ